MVFIYGYYPDERAETYQGEGALGRTILLSSGNRVIQIFPNGCVDENYLNYTLGHEYAELAWVEDVVSHGGEATLDDTIEKEKHVDALARSWGFELPKSS